MGWRFGVDAHTDDFDHRAYARELGLSATKADALWAQLSADDRRHVAVDPTAWLRQAFMRAAEAVSRQRPTPGKRALIQGAMSASEDHQLAVHTRNDALRAVVRGEVLTIARVLALETSGLEIVLDGRARDRLASAGVRGMQVGRSVFLHPEVVERGGADRRYLLAHELVHAAQRQLPTRPGLGHRAAEAEATSLGRAYARGESLVRPSIGLSGNREAHDDPTPDEQKLLASPIPVTRSVNLFNVRYRPATALKWVGGLDKKKQALAAMLKDFVGGSAYTVALLDEMIAARGGIVTFTGTGGLEGKATQDEAVTDFHIEGPLVLELVAWLTQPPRNLKVSLTQENLDVLQGGIDAADTYEDIKDALHLWTTKSVYSVFMGLTQKTVLTTYAKALRAVQKSPSVATDAAHAKAKVAALDALEVPFGVLEAVRTDRALVKEKAYRVLWDLPGVEATKDMEVAIAPEDKPPANGPALYFLTDQLVDKALAKEALKSSAARKKILERFATRLALRELPTDGDMVMRDGAAKPNRPPLGSTLTTYPQLEPPFFDTPKGGDREFTMSVEFNDFFEAFRGYVYKWELIHVPDDEIQKLNETADNMKEHGESPGQLDVLGSRLSRDAEYGSADIKRSIGSISDVLGPPGLGATDLVAANAGLRMVGTVIKTFLETILKPRYEKTMPFDSDGLYVVRCISWPQPSDTSVIDRTPSVAWLPVWVRPARDMSKLRVNLDGKLKLGAIDRLKEIETRLAETGVPQSERDALLKEQQQIETSLHGQGEDLLAMEKQALNDAIKTEPAGFKRDQLKKRIDEIDEIVKMRKERVADAKGGKLEPVTRIPAAFVGDNGQTIRPLFEVYQNPNVGASLVYHAIDSTTKNSGHRDGAGATREDAIARAIQNILESDQGYGRGFVTLSIPPAKGATTTLDAERTIRIEKNLGALAMESIDNLATVAAIAAIAAAPFTGGASLALLVPIGIVGAIPSAYRLIDRAGQGTLRFDMATAMDVVNILGAAVGAGQANAIGKAALRGMQVGRGWMILGLGADGLGMLVAGAGMIDQINELSKDPNMPSGLRNAMIAQIVGAQLVQLGVAAGAALVTKGKAQQEAHGGSKKPIDITHAPIDAPLREKFQTEVGPKGKDIPVLRDASGSQVSGTGVEIHYVRDGYGLPTDIRVIAGPGAGEAEIMIHAKTAKTMLEYQGLIGFLRNLLDRVILTFQGKAPPKKGSRAWEAKLELEKLPLLIDQVFQDLASKKLTPDAAASKIKDLRAQMATHEKALNDLSPGKGVIAAHDSVSKAAVAAGYPPLPAEHFYFETPDGTYQLQRNADSTAPPQHVVFKGGKWELAAGAPPRTQDMTSLRTDLAAKLGVPADKVVLDGKSTGADVTITPKGDGYEIHFKAGTPEETLHAAAERVREQGHDATWVTDLKNQLGPDQKHRLELMTKGKTPAEIFALFGGDVDVAIARVGGSNLPNDLIKIRGGLSDKARKAFDAKWNQMIGGERSPTAAKVDAFKKYLDAMAAKADGSLQKGLEKVVLPAGAKTEAPKANPYPDFWSSFDEAGNAAFKERLEALRGTDDLDSKFRGGEGVVFELPDGKSAIKRWFKERLKDIVTSIKLLRDAKTAVAGNKALSEHLSVVDIHETGPDFIIRDFVGDSKPLKQSAAEAAPARKAAIEALEAKSPRTEIEENLLQKLIRQSDNLHWSPSAKKIIVIDMM